jgi:hypothetical protein
MLGRVVYAAIGGTVTDMYAPMHVDSDSQLASVSKALWGITCTQVSDVSRGSQSHRRPTHPFVHLLCLCVSLCQRLYLTISSHLVSSRLVSSHRPLCLALSRPRSCRSLSALYIFSPSTPCGCVWALCVRVCGVGWGGVGWVGDKLCASGLWWHPPHTSLCLCRGRAASYRSAAVHRLPGTVAAAVTVAATAQPPVPGGSERPVPSDSRALARPHA